MLRPALTDNERFPLLTERKLLDDLRQDAFAPRYNFASGDRLDAEMLNKVQQYALELSRQKFWRQGELPEWLGEYLAWCRAAVPAYRDYPDNFLLVPTMRRPRLAAQPWQFVADDCNLDNLLVYSTSGTTGAPMPVLFEPVAQATWLPQLETILARDSIGLDGGSKRVSICLVCSQQETLTYASLSTYLHGAGVLKINLQPGNWSDPQDRVSFLEKYNPEILTGDPFSFLALLALKPKIKPKALVSSAVALQAGVRERLAGYFACPVYDVYSLTECRMIACSSSNAIHQLIRPELYLEIMHPERDQVLPEGERGEIVVSGGNNPFLPLLRYRTGDFAALRHNQGKFELFDLLGRSPAIYLNERGEFVNNVDIARAMCRFALAGYNLHQHSDRRLTFTGWGEEAGKDEIEKVLRESFGPSLPMSLEIKTPDLNEVMKVQFSSDIDEKELQL